VAGLLEELEPVLAEIVVTTNSSPRAMPAAELAELATEIFGEDRVRVTRRLDDALDLAVSLVDAEDDDAGSIGSTAVLVTGSVVTAGDAQLLLDPRHAVGSSANAGYAARAARGDAT
jgi:dihydrofolate synthase/folylpolyglutamate synthase